MSNSPANIWAASVSKVAKMNDQEGSFTFGLLAFILFLLFFRPADLFTALKVLHLPMIFVIICFGSHLVSSSSRGEPIFRITPITKVLAALTLWCLICVPFAYWQGGALATLVNDWMKMLVLFVLMVNVILTVKQLRIAIWICVLCATVVSVTAIVGFMLHGSLDASGRLTALVNGPYAGANYFAVTIVLMLPFALFDAFLHPRIIVRILSFVCCGIFVVATLLTQSRAGIAGMVLVSMLFLWQLRKWGKSLTRIFVITALLVPLAAVLTPHGVWVRFSTLFEDYDVSSLSPTSGLRMAAGSQKERLQLIYKAVTLTLDRPIFGVGMGDFSSASAHTWTSGSGRDWVQTHNTYLQISSELGIPGLALYITLLVVTFRTLRRARDQIPEGGPGTKPYMLRLLCDATRVSLIGYLLTSAFANVGYQPYYFIIAGIGQAIALVALKVTANEPQTVPRPAPAWPPEAEASPV
jgi:O-antigen ligase